LVKDSYPMKRCALCGGPLGLISHREGMLRFCKLAHKTAYIERKREQLKAEQRRKSGSIFLAAAPLSFLIFGAPAPATSRRSPQSAGCHPW